MDAQKKGHIKGFQYSPSLSLTHLLFVDDVILFGLGTVEEWGAYKEAPYLFCSATVMSSSMEKYSFLYQNVDEETRRQISMLLPYSTGAYLFKFQIPRISLKTSGVSYL